MMDYEANEKEWHEFVDLMRETGAMQEGHATGMVLANICV